MAYRVLVTQPPTVGAVIAQRVRKYRLLRDWSFRRLAEECAKHGAPQLTAASLANIERGQDSGAKRKRRDVTAEELLVLGYVLDVPPVNLMLPMGEEDETPVLPDIRLHPFVAYQWITGMLAWDRHMITRRYPPFPGLDEDAYQSAVRPIVALGQLAAMREVCDIWRTNEDQEAYRRHLTRFRDDLRVTIAAGIRPLPVPKYLIDDMEELEAPIPTTENTHPFFRDPGVASQIQRISLRDSVPIEDEGPPKS